MIFYWLDYDGGLGGVVELVATGRQPARLITTAIPCQSQRKHILLLALYLVIMVLNYKLGNAAIFLV